MMSEREGKIIIDLNTHSAALSLPPLHSEPYKAYGQLFHLTHLLFLVGQSKQNWSDALLPFPNGINSISKISLTAETA
jgi:hypothetical protein